MDIKADAVAGNIGLLATLISWLSDVTIIITFIIAIATLGAWGIWYYRWWTGKELRDIFRSK